MHYGHINILIDIVFYIKKNNFCEQLTTSRNMMLHDNLKKIFVYLKIRKIRQKKKKKKIKHPRTCVFNVLEVDHYISTD